MTMGKELLGVQHDPLRRSRGRWVKAREAAGINSNDETANMFPSEAIAYRLLRDAEFVPRQTFYDTVFEGRQLKAPRASLDQVMRGLRNKLPKSIGATLVSVRSEGNSGYALVALGKEQETIERYAREREERATEEAERQRQSKESSMPKAILLGHLPLGTAVISTDLFHLMYPDAKLTSAREQTSRLIRETKRDIEAKGETILGRWTEDGYVYIRTRVDDAEGMRAEIASQRPARRPSRDIKPRETPEITLEEDVEVDIISLDDPEEPDDDLDDELDEEGEGLSLRIRGEPRTPRITKQKDHVPSKISLEEISHPNIPHDELFGIAVILRASMRKIEALRTQYGITLWPTHIDTINEIMARIMTDEEKKSAQTSFRSGIFTQTEERIIDYVTNRDSYKRLHPYERWMLRWFDNLSPKQAQSFFSSLKPVFKIE